jgi:crotonyl-CoA carboxylase/reductase
MGKDLYEIGEIPPIGEVPSKMWANLMRPENYNAERPEKAFTIEEVDTPPVEPRQVLVLVMAAGINFNNVWAATGIPIDVTKTHAKLGQNSDYHIGGSDASGVVWAVGERVKGVEVGQRVIVHPGWWDPEEPAMAAGVEPGFTDAYKIWGYETNYGAFGQFCIAYDHQILPKAPQLTWEEAAASTLVGTTAYRMLRGWPPNVVGEGDPVLIWGGGGGLGSQAIQLVRHFGGIPVAAELTDEKLEYCKTMGAAGVIDGRDFDHFGLLPHWTDDAAFAEWFQGAKSFGKAFWEALGEKRSPKIVFEHVGEKTIPTSIFMCDSGGMVVICAGTTGYNAVVDLRYLWMRQKRFQGSHGTNDVQAQEYNQLVNEGKIDPCLGQVFPFEGIGEAHQVMFENKHRPGNMAALVSASAAGQKDLPS